MSPREQHLEKSPPVGSPIGPRCGKPEALAAAAAPAPNEPARTERAEQAEHADTKKKPLAHE